MHRFGGSRARAFKNVSNKSKMQHFPSLGTTGKSAPSCPLKMGAKHGKLIWTVVGVVILMAGVWYLTKRAYQTPSPSDVKTDATATPSSTTTETDTRHDFTQVPSTDHGHGRDQFRVIVDPSDEAFAIL